MPRAYAGVGRGNGSSWLFPMEASPTASLDEGTILAVHTALFVKAYTVESLLGHHLYSLAPAVNEKQ